MNNQQHQEPVSGVERVEQLESGIKEFLNWLTLKRPDIAGAGAPISILRGLLVGNPVLSPSPVSNGDAVDDWVRVEDGLPEINEMVLLTTKDRMVHSGRYMFDQGRHPYYYEVGNSRCRPSFVTHWRPFPKPPISKQ